jgi:hypothetical protein
MRTGYIIDAPDDRDLPASDLMGLSPHLPPSISHVSKLVDILDQDNSNTCVTHAIMQSVQMLVGGKLGSVLFPYFMGRIATGTQHTDVGSRFRDVFRAMERWGFCLETSWPFDLSKVNVMPNRTACHRALPAREGDVDRTTYRRITESGTDRIDAVKRVVAAGYTVCFGTQIDRDFQRGRFDPEEPQSPPKGDSVGGHAMLIVGYDARGCLVANSYGKRFGRDGFFWMSWEWLAWSKLSDLWVIEKAPRPEGR